MDIEGHKQEVQAHADLIQCTMFLLSNFHFVARGSDAAQQAFQNGLTVIATIRPNINVPNQN